MEVKYSIINSKDIVNLCGPERTPAGWTLEAVEKRRHQTEQYIRRINKINGFYEKLEKSILEEGFRNPILVCAGFFSEEYKKIDPKIPNTNALRYRIDPSLLKRDKELTVCNVYGGSRLWIAQKHNLEIPCIINDFIELFSDLPELKTDEDVLKYFTDKPENLRFQVTGVFFSALPQTHMED